MTLLANRSSARCRRLRGLPALVMVALAAVLAGSAALRSTAPLAQAQTLGANTLAWSIGGPGASEVRQAAADIGGNLFVTGVFSGSVDADPGPGERTLVSAGDIDIFLAKYAPDGSLLWAWSIGGPAADQAYAVATDLQGRVYLAGGFAGAVDFEPGEAEASVDAGAERHGFVARYDGNGALIWVTPLGLAGDDEVMALAVDAAGNAVAAGLATMTTIPDRPFPVHRGTPFAVRLESDGRLRWSAVLPTASEGHAPVSITVGSGGELFLATSYTGTVRVALGAGLLEATSAGASDILVMKLTSTGTLAWARSIGGPGADTPGTGGLARDADGNIVLAGAFEGTVDVSGDGSKLLESQGSRDVIVVSLDGAGDVRWASSLGSPGVDGGLQVVADGARHVYLTAWFTGSPRMLPDLDGASIRGLRQNGVADGLLAKFSPDGRLAWAYGFSGHGSGAEQSGLTSTVALDPRGSVWAGGRFFGTDVDIDPGPGVTILSSSGQGAGFVVGVGPDGRLLTR